MAFTSFLFWYSMNKIVEICKNVKPIVCRPSYQSPPSDWERFEKEDPMRMLTKEEFDKEVEAGQKGGYYSDYERTMRLYYSDPKDKQRRFQEWCRKKGEEARRQNEINERRWAQEREQEEARKREEQARIAMVPTLQAQNAQLMMQNNQMQQQLAQMQRQIDQLRIQSKGQNSANCSSQKSS